jgi:ABC-type nitrate/sulfonate/bicarbonate transport system substrate-binding protein
MTHRVRPLFSAAFLVAFLLGSLGNAHALTKVHAGKAVAVAWSFIPLDVGVKEGIFAKYGLDVDITSFEGDAKLQQGLASGSIDFGVGSGPALAFVAKGAPVIGVAAFAGAPRNISIVLGAKSSITKVSELKGKIIGVTTAGSLTDWLVHRVSLKEGWGRDGIKIAALGGFQPELAALRTHQIDGMMTATEAGYMLDEKHDGRILVGMQEYAPVFITHVVFARKELVDKNPDLVRNFLKGFFGSIVFMKAHKAETDEVAESVLHESPAVASKVYDYEISMLQTDGRFDPDALTVLKQSFLDMGMLETKPANDQLFTTKFVLVKP